MGAAVGADCNPWRDALVQRLRIGDYLVYLVVRILICAVQAMRMETGQLVARRLAWLFTVALKIRSKVVDDNLLHAYPDLPPEGRRRLARQMWEHLFLLVMEVAHTPRKIHETNWRKHVKLTGEDVLVGLMLNDRPTIIVSGHFGNFEVGGYLLGVLGFPTFTVARKLDNPYLDAFVNRFRRATGQVIIPKKGGYDQILDVLEHNGTMLFLADQYAGVKECWVEFFNRPASVYKAIALLALHNDAPVAVSYSRRLDRPMHFELGTVGSADPREAGDEVGSIRRLTQWYTQKLEQVVRLAPEQYWWVHRRWKDPRPEKKNRRKKAA
jgi:KDO2-lipid IV(A) lauroyltransferase